MKQRELLTASKGLGFTLKDFLLHTEACNNIKVVYWRAVSYDKARDTFSCFPITSTEANAAYLCEHLGEELSHYVARIQVVGSNVHNIRVDIVRGQL